VGPARLFNSHRELWPLVAPMWLTCVVFQVRLIRVSVTPSDMGDACSLLSFHYVHMRFTVMFNYNYLIVENDDTKNG
jgi:hypothetical protein